VSPDASEVGGGVCVGGCDGGGLYCADATVAARIPVERQTAARNATVRFINSLPGIAQVFVVRRVGAAV
jgi:hypothetical protein